MYAKIQQIFNFTKKYKNFACARAKAEGIAEGEAKGKAEWKAEWKAEGKGERSMEIASLMKADGVPVDAIAKYSGLSEAEIKAL